MPCVNCGGQFERKAKGYRRFSLQKCMYQSRELREIISDIFDYEEITQQSASSASNDERSLCLACFNDVDNTEKRRLSIIQKLEEIEDFKKSFISRSVPGSFLSTFKLQSDGEERPREAVISSLSTKWPKGLALVGQIIRPITSKRPEPLAESGPELVKHNGKYKKKSKKATPMHLSDKGLKKSQRQFGFRRKAAAYIETSKYRNAFGVLVKNPNARKCFLYCVQRLVRKEMAIFNKQEKCISITMEMVKNFNWVNFFEEVKKGLPLLYAVFESSVTKRRSPQSLSKVKIDADGKIGPLVPGLGLALSILLRLRCSAKFKLVPSIIGVQLFKNCCNRKLQSSLFKAGLCLSVHSTRNLLKRMKLLEEANNKEKDASKQSLETFFDLQNCMTGQTEDDDQNEEDPENESNAEMSDMEEDSSEEEASEADEEDMEAT